MTSPKRFIATLVVGFLIASPEVLISKSHAADRKGSKGGDVGSRTDDLKEDDKVIDTLGRTGYVNKVRSDGKVSIAYEGLDVFVPQPSGALARTHGESHGFKVGDKVMSEEYGPGLKGVVIGVFPNGALSVEFPGNPYVRVNQTPDQLSHVPKVPDTVDMPTVPPKPKPTGLATLDCTFWKQRSPEANSGSKIGELHFTDDRSQIGESSGPAYKITTVHWSGMTFNYYAAGAVNCDQTGCALNGTVSEIVEPSKEGEGGLSNMYSMNVSPQMAKTYQMANGQTLLISCHAPVNQNDPRVSSHKGAKNLPSVGSGTSQRKNTDSDAGVAH